MANTRTRQIEYLSLKDVSSKVIQYLGLDDWVGSVIGRISITEGYMYLTI